MPGLHPVSTYLNDEEYAQLETYRTATHRSKANAVRALMVEGLTKVTSSGAFEMQTYLPIIMGKGDDDDE